MPLTTPCRTGGQPAALRAWRSSSGARTPTGSASAPHLGATGSTSTPHATAPGGTTPRPVRTESRPPSSGPGWR